MNSVVRTGRRRLLIYVRRRLLAGAVDERRLRKLKPRQDESDIAGRFDAGLKQAI